VEIHLVPNHPNTGLIWRPIRTDQLIWFREFKLSELVLIAACLIYGYFETPARRWIGSFGVRDAAANPGFTLQPAL
jgi:hypothetical protein